MQQVWCVIHLLTQSVRQLICAGRTCIDKANEEDKVRVL